MSETCSAKGCQRRAALMIVDNFQPMLDRKQIPACARHALVWYRKQRV